MIWKLLKKRAGITAANKNHAVTALPLDFLKKLIPIGELSADELLALKSTLRSFEEGEVVFGRGDVSSELIYLYEGEIYLESVNGNGYLVDASTFKACYPLSTSTEQRLTAIARSSAKVVYLPLSVLKRSSAAAFVNKPLITPTDVPPSLQNSGFFKGFCEAIKYDQLVVPTLPDVALQLRKALQNEIGVADVVKIINLDPVISSKLIQVVNNPVYRAHKAITNTQDAVLRLGMHTTQNIVTGISLNNLFHSRDKRLNDRIKRIWQQSIQVASISCTLASLNRKINPDEALLAGLVHKIGILPILAYAENRGNERYTEEELDQTISLLQGRVGEFILQKWSFPNAMRSIPSQAANWYHDNASGIQLSDIVILARFHSELGDLRSQNLPPINTLPAFQKLGDNALTPEMSLQALADAKQQIAETLSLFKNQT
ncbi:HDOD domain-containing protein [Methylomicrobium sp. RS1]|jgi:HD-like signal output (HDOD) protein|nr:HDOD domain-containing protein [Methylomicrobium sp. RS1]